MNKLFMNNKNLYNINMQSALQRIKDLFDSANIGRIVEDLPVTMDVSLDDQKANTEPASDDVSEYASRLRKRHHESQYDDLSNMDIDSVLLLEQNDTSRKKTRYEEQETTLDGFSELSPDSKNIVMLESTANRQALIYDIIRDNEKIENVTSLLEAIDGEFSYTLPSEVGNHMELWICVNMKCPGCRVGILYKYISSNMPVIDVKCFNTEHNLLEHGPIFYQIKATERNVNFLGKKYFTRQPIQDYPSGYIKVGSKRSGVYSHSITTADTINDKYISIGYICISYYYLTNRRRINIDLRESFVVIPNLSYQTRTRTNDYYYKYIPNSLNMAIITFNPDIRIVNVLTFAELIDRDNYLVRLFKNINLDKQYITITYHRPTPATRELIFDNKYQAKYLYYKNKYLLLKNKNLNLLN
jgi:hypothetical protein